MIYSTLLLACAAQADLPTAHAVRDSAWTIYREELDAAQLVQAYGSFKPEPQEQWLLAAARGARQASDLIPLLDLAWEQQDREVAPSAGFLALLQRTPLTKQQQERLRAWLPAPQWREPATLALLRVGAGPEILQDYEVLLESAMLTGWRPAGDVLGEFFAIGKLRPSLWPGFIGTSISAAETQAIAQLDASQWSETDQFLRHLLLADQKLPNPASAKLVWDAWLRLRFSSRAAAAIEQAIARHLPWITEADLRGSLESLPRERLFQALEMLASIAPAGAAAVLREAALAPEWPTELRVLCAAAVFRCGSDAEVQALVPLLQAQTPQDLLLTVLAGMRFRPAAQLAELLEPLMPRLRTRAAVIAVELMVLHGDDALRLRWLDKLRALPVSDQHRIVQAACAVMAQETVLPWAKSQALSDREDAAQRGRIALSALLSPADAAAFYRQRITAEKDPNQRQRLLFALREMRTDEALEGIVDWLASEEGRSHETSLQWAALLIEEDAASRAFEAWWQNREQLPQSLVDTAAVHLAVNPGEARDEIWARLDSLPEALATRFLIRLTARPVARDAQRAVSILIDELAPELQRRSAAAIVAKCASSEPDAFELALQALRASASNESRPSAQWRVLVREAVVGSQDREELLAGLNALAASLPLEWELAVRTDLALADAQIDDDDARARATDRILTALYSTAEREHVDSTAAENELRRRHPGLFASIAQLASLEPDAPLSAALFLCFGDSDPQLRPPTLNADVVAVLARSFSAETELGTLTRQWLNTVEAASSWRRPPRASSSHPLPWTHASSANELFSHLQDRYEEGQVQGARAALQAAQQRWPRDRRVHLWQGWFALLESDFDFAEQAFMRAKECSGWLPYATLEPRLGLEVTAALSGAGLAELQALLEKEDQGAALLRGRTQHAAWSELTSLLDLDD